MAQAYELGGWLTWVHVEHSEDDMPVVTLTVELDDPAQLQVFSQQLLKRRADLPDSPVQYPESEPLATQEPEMSAYHVTIGPVPLAHLRDLALVLAPLQVRILAATPTTVPGTYYYAAEYTPPANAPSGNAASVLREQIEARYQREHQLILSLDVTMTPLAPPAPGPPLAPYKVWATIEAPQTGVLTRGRSEPLCLGEFPSETQARQWIHSLLVVAHQAPGSVPDPAPAAPEPRETSVKNDCPSPLPAAVHEDADEELYDPFRVS